MIRVTVWNEYVHEKKNHAVAEIYPNGIHGCIAEFLGKNDDMVIKTATLDQEEHGLTDAVLDDTDVLIWWGHVAHGQVSDEVVAKVCDRVRRGMGLIALHSAHNSKVFHALMGTTCSLRWRDNAREHVWCVAPSHPIAKGVPSDFRIDREEMYGEFFDIPTPDELIYLGWFNGGEVFRSGCVFNRAYGKVFYFQPGHETNPIFHMPQIQTIITNAVRYLYNDNKQEKVECSHTAPVEP